jgi:hypothetical protein
MISEKTRRYDLATPADVDAVLHHRSGPFQTALYAAPDTCCLVGIHVDLGAIAAAAAPAADGALLPPSALPPSMSSRTNGGGGVKVAALSMAWGLPGAASGGCGSPSSPPIVTATMTAATFAGGDCTDAAVGVLQMLVAAAEDPYTALRFMTLDARRLARALALLLPPQSPGDIHVPLSTCTLDLRVLDAVIINGPFRLADLFLARHVVPDADSLCKRFMSIMREQGLESTTGPPSGGPVAMGGCLATSGQGAGRAVPASVNLAGAALVVAHAITAPMRAGSGTHESVSYIDRAVRATGRAMNLWTPGQHLTLCGEAYEHYLCADRLPFAIFSPLNGPIEDEVFIVCGYCHRNLPWMCFDRLDHGVSSVEAAENRQRSGAVKCGGCVRIDTIVQRSQIRNVLVDDDAAALQATQRLMPLMQDGRFIVGFDAEWHTPAPYPFGKEGSVLSLVQISVTRLPITPKSQVEVILYDALGLSRPVLAECLTLLLGTQIAQPAAVTQVQLPSAAGGGRPLTDTDVGGLRLGFDIRRDAEIIRFTTGVEIATPLDLQLLEIARRHGDTAKVRSLRGLKRCLGPMTALAHLSGAKGGVQMTHGDAASSEIFLQRPLPDSVVEYSVMDAALLPFVFAAMCDELWDINPDLTAAVGVKFHVVFPLCLAEWVRHDLALVKAASLRYASYVASLQPSQEKYAEHGFLPLGILLECDTDRGSSRCAGCGRDVALWGPYCTVCHHINTFRSGHEGATARGSNASAGGGNRMIGSGGAPQRYHGGGRGRGRGRGFSGFSRGSY